MKKWERIVVYAIAVFASIYSIWAHDKLQRIYRINKEAPSFYTPHPTRGTGAGLRQLCLVSGELELTGWLKNRWLSKGTRSVLIARLSNNIKFYLNPRWGFSSLEKLRSALIDAINAEIDVLSYESQMFENDSSYRWYNDPVYKSLMDKSIVLRARASMQIFHKMEEI